MGSERGAPQLYRERASRLLSLIIGIKFWASRARMLWALDGFETAVSVVPLRCADLANYVSVIVP